MRRGQSCRPAPPLNTTRGGFLTQRLTALGLALTAFLLATSSSAQTLTVQQINPANTTSEGWKNEGSPTSGGQIMFFNAGGDVYLYNGTTIVPVQAFPGQAIDHVWTLGSGATAGHVIGGYRRGAGYLDVTVDGGAPVKVDQNPESIAIADGCVFAALQTNGAAPQHAYQINPATGAFTQISTGGNATANASHIASGSGCKAAWSWAPTNTSTFGIQYWSGTATTTLETDADLQYGTPMRRGVIVYVKQVSGVSQVFAVDTNTSLTPVQLSAETDATKYLHPLTDGRHVAWYRCTQANCTDGQIMTNGGLVYPAGPLGLIDAVTRLPFELDRGQLLWKTASGAFVYDDGKQAIPVQINPSPATTIQLPFLTDGSIAFLGQGGSDAGTDLEVFRITGTVPDDANQPSPPLLVTATGGAGQATVAWDSIVGATSYNLYLANEPGVTKSNYNSLAGGRKIANVTSPYTVTSLTKNQYYFSVTAVDGTEGPSSRVATAFVSLAWQAVGGLPATNFFSVASDQANASNVYAGTTGVYRSTDGGITWTQTLSGATTAANRIAALAVNGANVFANSMTNADIWKSTTSGTSGSWIRILDASGFGEQQGAMRIDPVTPTTMYASDFILPGKTLAQSLVIKSTNGGSTWTHTAEAPAPSDNIHAYALAIDPNNPTVMYAGGSGQPNIARTADGGTSWTDVPISGNNGPVTSLVVDSGNSNVVYATTRDAGFFKTTNNGATWTAYNSGLTGTEFNSVLLDTQNPQMLHLGAANGYFYSLNGGLTWTAANNGFTTTPYFYSLALTPARRLIAATSDGLYMLSIGAAPTVTGVLPATGDPAGGTSLTIAGTGFQPGATVRFDGILATSTWMNATTITATTPAHAAGPVPVSVTNFDTASGSLASAFTYTVPGPPPAPAGVVATAQTTTSVFVSWNAVSGATSYRVLRRDPGSATFNQLPGTPTATSYTDSTAVATTSYLYLVHAVNASGTSVDSAADIATTVIFADDPITTGVPVKALHLSQLRTAVNAVRLLQGLGGLTFTDAAVAGLVVKAFHVTDMRAALDAALGPLGFGTGGYTDTSLNGVVIKGAHFQEIRNRMK